MAMLHTGPAAPYVYHDGSILLADGSDRENYARHYRGISTTREFKATLRAGQWAWPGGYECFLITSDGAALCFDCARDNFRLICESINTVSRDGWQIGRAHA